MLFQLSLWARSERTSLANFRRQMRPGDLLAYESLISSSNSKIWYYLCSFVQTIHKNENTTQKSNSCVMGGLTNGQTEHPTDTPRVSHPLSFTKMRERIWKGDGRRRRVWKQMRGARKGTDRNKWCRHNVIKTAEKKNTINMTAFF